MELKSVTLCLLIYTYSEGLLAICQCGCLFLNDIDSEVIMRNSGKQAIKSQTDEAFCHLTKKTTIN